MTKTDGETFGFLSLRQLKALNEAIKKVRADGALHREAVKNHGEVMAYRFDREIAWLAVDKRGKAVAHGQLPLEAKK